MPETLVVVCEFLGSLLAFVCSFVGGVCVYRALRTTDRNRRVEWLLLAIVSLLMAILAHMPSPVSVQAIRLEESDA